MEPNNSVWEESHGAPSEVESEPDEKFGGQEPKDPLAITEDTSWSVRGSEMCHHCGYTSESKEEMEFHLKLSHKGSLNRDTFIVVKPSLKFVNISKVWPHRCSHCENCFSKASDLERHVQTEHTLKRTRPCSHCNFTFEDVDSLSGHLQSVHKLFFGINLCPHCQYWSGRLTVLKEHIMSKHTMERPFKCTRCDSRFLRRRDLKRHIMSKHTMERPHKCPYCGYNSVDIGNMRRHIRAKHPTGCFPQCPHCEYRGVDMDNVKKHIKIKHKETISPECIEVNVEKAEPQNQCPKCNYFSVDTDHLNIHMQNNCPMEDTTFLGGKTLVCP